MVAIVLVLALEEGEGVEAEGVVLFALEDAPQTAG